MEHLPSIAERKVRLGLSEERASSESQQASGSPNHGFRNNFSPRRVSLNPPPVKPKPGRALLSSTHSVSLPDCAALSSTHSLSLPDRVPLSSTHSLSLPDSAPPSSTHSVSRVPLSSTHSVSLPGRAPPSSTHAVSGCQKKPRMSEKPPVAPKSELVKNLSPARPRKKRPPPTRPVPYARHKEAKDNDFTSFLSSAPLRSHPPPEAPPRRPPRRVSALGDPSPNFYEPVAVPEPIQYAIPKVPKRQKSEEDPLSSRPRVNTPWQPPEPPPTVSNGIQLHVGETTGSHDPVDQTTHVDLKAQAEVLYAEAYGDTPQTQGGEEEQEMYWEIKDTSVKAQPTVAPPIVQSPSPVPARAKSPSPLRAKSPSPLRGKSPSPLRAKSPSPARAKSPSPMRVKSPSPARVKSPSPSGAPPPRPDNEYDVTMHLLDSKRGASPHPQPFPSPVAPPQPDEEKYSVLDRPEKQAFSPSSPLPLASSDYSPLEIPSNGERETNGASQEAAYDLLDIGEPDTATQLEEIEGYEVLRPEPSWRSARAKSPSPSRPSPSRPVPAPKPRESPKTKARKASIKARAVKLGSARDRSVLMTYTGGDGGPRQETGSVPSPKLRRRHQYEDLDGLESTTEHAAAATASPNPQRPPLVPEPDQPGSATSHAPLPRPRRQHQYEDLDEPLPSRYEAAETYSTPPEREQENMEPWTGGDSVPGQEPSSPELASTQRVEVDIDLIRSRLQMDRHDNEERKAEGEREGGVKDEEEEEGGEHFYAEIPDRGKRLVVDPGSDTEYANQEAVDSLHLGDSVDPGPPPVALKYPNEFWPPDATTESRDTGPRPDAPGDGTAPQNVEEEGETAEGPKLKPSAFLIVQHVPPSVDPQGYCEVEVNPVCPPQGISLSEDAGSEERSLRDVVQQGGAGQPALDEGTFEGTQSVGYAYVTAPPVQARKEPSRQGQMGGTGSGRGGGKEEDVVEERGVEEHKPKKPTGLPRRRPPPPPIRIPAASKPPTLATQTSNPSPKPDPAPRIHLPKVAPRQGGPESPKPKERSGILNRVKSRSLRKSKPKSPRENGEKSTNTEASPGLGRRLKGMFKSSNVPQSVDGQQGKAVEGAVDERKAATLPGRSRREPTSDLPEDTYSVIPDNVTEDIELDSDAYAIVDVCDRTLHRSTSMEQLSDSLRRSPQGFRDRAGSRSASNSPQLTKKPRHHAKRPLPPPPVPHPHIATLPRTKRGDPPLKLSQFYTAPTTPPAAESVPQRSPEVPTASGELQTETFELEMGSSDSSTTASDTRTPVSSSLGGESSSLKDVGSPLSDDDGGVVSSEILHTLSGEGSLYAVIDPKAILKKRSKTEPSESVKDDERPPEVGGGAEGEGPSLPPKPHKVAPPKPPPYYRESYRGPVPPQDGPTLGQKSALGTSLQSGVVNQRSGAKLLEERSVSVEVGPPSFPPPPPPPSDDVGGEHTYEVPAEILESAARKDKQDGQEKPVLQGEDDAESAPLATNVEAVREEMILIADQPSTPPVLRPPHLYDLLPEGAGDVPRSLAVPMREHIYEPPPEMGGKKRVRSHKRTSQFPQLPKKTKPPPDPPSAKPTAGQAGARPKHSPVVKQPSTPVSSNPASIQLEPVCLGGKKPVEPRTDKDSPEPKFLFPEYQSRNFLVVGQEGHNPVPSPSMSMSTLSAFDDDSDRDQEDSTEWETSSGGEDGEEELRPPSPVRPKTYYIAREILTTERTFVKGLALLDRDFRQTVLSAIRAHEKVVIPEESLKQILGNVGSLLSLNSGMLQELEERMEHWDHDPRIGDVLLSRAPYLKIYTEYISKFDKALKHLDECTKKYPLFAEVLQEFEAQPKCAHLPLASYLLEIVQRIPRYKLLLTDYIKHLPEDSVDMAPSTKALEVISSVATHVNETIRLMDNFRKVVEVRKKLIGDSGDSLITPYRKLIKEGELMKSSRKEKQPRMFFLFNDILIYAYSIPPANTTYKVIKRIPLDGMKVEPLDDPEMRYGFQIISTCKSFRLDASSMEEAQQWLAAFEAAIKENSGRIQSRAKAQMVYHTEKDKPDMAAPLGQLAPAWLPDSAVSMCQLCSVHFMVTRRRHHCRACGMIFCSDCSSYLAPLKYMNNKLGRVCQSCYGNITQGEEGDDSKPPVKKRTKAGYRSQKFINMPSVLREVRARDQSAQVSGYLLSHTSKTKRWRKKWFVVYNLVMYEFERHEDVSAKRSITLPSYEVVSPAPRQDDPLVFCLKHPGIGNHFFKVDSDTQLRKWLDVLERAVRGETDDEAHTHPDTSSQRTESLGQATDSDV